MTTTMVEPEWDEQTRNLALAYELAPLCPACGGPIEECQNPEREFEWMVPPPVRCHRKTALGYAQRGVDEKTNPVPEALLWSVVSKESGR